MTLGAAQRERSTDVYTQVAARRPTVGRQAVLEELLSFFRAFPDNYTRPVNLFEDGEWAVLEWTGRGTRRGEFAGGTRPLGSVSSGFRWPSTGPPNGQGTWRLAAR